MTSIIERLKQLEAAATPVPWKDNIYGRIEDLSGEDFIDIWRVNHQPDAALIAEMRSALPALLRVVEVTQKLVDPNAPIDYGWSKLLSDAEEALAALELTPSHSQPEAAHSQLSKEEK